MDFKSTKPKPSEMSKLQIAESTFERQPLKAVDMGRDAAESASRMEQEYDSGQQYQMPYDAGQKQKPYEDERPLPTSVAQRSLNQSVN